MDPLSKRSSTLDFGYAPAPDAEEAIVTVVTDVDESSHGLRETAESLAQQSLQRWEWLVVSPTSDREATLRFDDKRIRVISTPTRAVGMHEALEAAAEYVLVLEGGDVLSSTSLEKWVWFLDARQDCMSVQGSSAASTDPANGFPRRLMRKRDVIAFGGLDGAVAAAIDPATTGIVPHSGGPVPPGVPYAGLLPPYHQSPNEWLPEDAPMRNRLEKRARRLLLVTPWMAVGGADTFNLDLIEHLRGEGWEATVATTLAHDHALFPQYADLTPDLFPLAEFMRLIDYPRFLVHLVESRRPDVVVVSNSELGYRLLPYLRARCPETPLVDFCHSEAEHWNNGGYPRLSVEYHELLDLTIVASRHLQRWMTDRGAGAERVEVCYANVDVDAIRPDATRREQIRNRLSIDEAEVVLLFVGRVSADKQPRVLAETIRDLRERGTSFTTIIAGDGPDLPWLRTFVKRSGLDRVHLLGELPHGEIAALMTAADVMLLPSRSEGIALTLYEAMAAGVPVVAAAVGGQAELVTPECGTLVAPGRHEQEVERYAGALAPLLQSAERRRRMGAAARSRVEAHFSIERMVIRMVELFDRAADLHQSDPRPTCTRRLSRALATQSVELKRLADVSDWMHRARTRRISRAFRSTGRNG